MLKQLKQLTFLCQKQNSDVECSQQSERQGKNLSLANPSRLLQITSKINHNVPLM
jgi:hypothetical protein